MTVDTEVKNCTYSLILQRLVPSLSPSQQSQRSQHFPNLRGKCDNFESNLFEYILPKNEGVVIYNLKVNFGLRHFIPTGLFWSNCTLHLDAATGDYDTKGVQSPHFITQ